MTDPKHRIRIVEGSLRCYALGWLALVPVLGVPCGVLALLLFRQTWPVSRDEWNPARRYLIWGGVFGLTGLLVSGLTGLGLNLLVLHHYEQL